MLGGHIHLLVLIYNQLIIDYLFSHVNILKWCYLSILLSIGDLKLVKKIVKQFKRNVKPAIISKSVSNFFQEFWSPFFGVIAIWSLVALLCPWISQVSQFLTIAE
jgi:hypothetical protein